MKNRNESDEAARADPALCFAPGAPTREHADDELISLLNMPGLWVVGNPFPLAMVGSLDAALRETHRHSMEGRNPGFIIRMPGDDIILHAHQIYRLWQRLGIGRTE